jgi:hypothetical protein
MKLSCNAPISIGDFRTVPHTTTATLQAYLGQCTAHVRFRGQSRHDLVRESAFAVAIGSKADMVLAPLKARRHDWWLN